MNITAIIAAVSAAASFWAGWQLQGVRMDHLKAEYTNEQLSRERSSQQALADAQAKVAAAQAAAQVATDRVRLDATRAVASGDRLRDTLSRSVVAAHTDLQTCTGQVTTISELLNTVVDAGGRIAKEADEWTTQAVILQSARPSDPP